MKRVDEKSEMKNSIDDDGDDDDYGYAVKDIITINHDIMNTTTNKRKLRNRGVDKTNNKTDADCKDDNDDNECLKLETNTTCTITTTSTSSSAAAASSLSSSSMIELDMISRNHIQDILLQLPGVGRKVADCISLFSLDQCSIIPIDTHVWSIVSRDYDTTLKEHKSLTPTVYHKVLVVMMLMIMMMMMMMVFLVMMMNVDVDVDDDSLEYDNVDDNDVDDLFVVTIKSLYSYTLDR